MSWWMKSLVCIAAAGGPVFSGQEDQSAGKPTGKSTHRWPQFRGEGASGTAVGDRLPLEWSETKNVAWKIPLPGLAWSSPVIWDGKIYVTTSASSGPPEAPKKGLYFGGERSKPPETDFKLELRCLDLATGKEHWCREIFAGPPNMPIHIKNTYASETPATNGKVIVVSFGPFGVACTDMAGQILWTKKIGGHPMKLNWGTGSSPVLDDELVYLQYDNEKKSFVAALNLKDGSEKWRKDRDEASSWSTPFLWRTDAGRELVTCATNRVRSYEPTTGELLWEIGRNSVIAVPTPVAGHGLLYVSSGYVMDPRYKPIYAVKPGVRGDITPKGAATTSNGLAWSARFGGAYMPSPVLADGGLYVLYDMGFISQFDAKTGAELYKRERLGKGGNQFTASPWAYRGRVMSVSETGNTFVVKAGKTFELERVNVLDGMFMASPAAADDRLLMRSDTHLYCIAEK